MQEKGIPKLEIVNLHILRKSSSYLTSTSSRETKGAGVAKWEIFWCWCFRKCKSNSMSALDSTVSTILLKNKFLNKNLNFTIPKNIKTTHNRMFLILKRMNWRNRKNMKNRRNWRKRNKKKKRYKMDRKNRIIQNNPQCHRNRLQQWCHKIWNRKKIRS